MQWQPCPNKIRDPKAQEAFRGAVQALPLHPWDAELNAQYEDVHSRVLRAAKSCFSQDKVAPKKRFVSNSTMDLIRMRRRCTVQAAKHLKLWKEVQLRFLLKLWKSVAPSTKPPARHYLLSCVRQALRADWAMALTAACLLHFKAQLGTWLNHTLRQERADFLSGIASKLTSAAMCIMRLPPPLLIHGTRFAAYGTWASESKTAAIAVKNSRGRAPRSSRFSRGVSCRRGLQSRGA